MENWDFSVLTGASLIPPTENKRYSYFFLVYHFFMTEASLDLKNHPIPFVCQKVWIWMTTKILLVSLGSERLSVKTSMQRVHTFHLVHDLRKWTFVLNQRRCQTLCIYAFANHLWVRHHIKNLLDYLPLQNPCIV